ncbi:MAG TPA: lysylphosphatidylglycerol synthase domain-containing protein, partial [Blastocatellia bacterium]|nr:lysylphosphatidylglycerol synthase domain-containing protein [Blastocatellia bacterium]
MMKSLLRKFEILSLVMGLALFAYLVRQTGLETLGHYLGMLGWGVAAILALSGVRNIFRAAAWYLAIEPEHRSIGFFPLTNVMLAGEAIKYLTATGPFLGEPAKAAMVRRDVPLLYGFSSIVVENLIYNLSVFLFIAAGLPALGWVVPVPGKFQAAAYIITAVVIFGFALSGLAMRRRWYFLSRLLERLSRSTLLGKRGRFGSAHGRMRSLEENVYSFYDRRRAAFYSILALDMASHLINILEVDVILAL